MLDYQWFVDMDGVLCDFRAGVEALGHAKGLEETAPEEDRQEMFKAIEKAGPQWWANLSWAPGGQELWEFLVKNSKPGYPPIILSSPGEGGRFAENAKAGKEIWINDNIPGTVYFFDTEKQAYANRDTCNVLIDDMQKNVDAWAIAGGTAVLHIATPQTIDTLQKVMAGEDVGHVPDEIAEMRTAFTQIPEGRHMRDATLDDMALRLLKEPEKAKAFAEKVPDILAKGLEGRMAVEFKGWGKSDFLTMVKHMERLEKQYNPLSEHLKRLAHRIYPDRG